VQGILDAACIPSLPVPLRTLMEACWANSKSSKVPAQPTARDLTNHMPPEQRSAAMARIRCCGFYLGRGAGVCRWCAEPMLAAERLAQMMLRGTSSL